MCNGKRRKLECLIWECQRGDLTVWLLDPSIDGDQVRKLFPLFCDGYLYLPHTGFQKLEKIRQISGLSE